MANSGDDQGKGGDLENRDKAARSELTRGERSIIGRFSTALRSADFVGFLMVLATAFSAYATWRVANVTSLLFAVAERPYLGISGIRFDKITPEAARVAVEFRNFGQISANDGVAQLRVKIGNQRVTDAANPRNTTNVGMVSPTVPHRVYCFISMNQYRQVQNGTAKLILNLRILYRGPDERRFCYNESFAYDKDVQSFDATGGSDKCSGEIY